MPNKKSEWTGVAAAVAIACLVAGRFFGFNAMMRKVPSIQNTTPSEMSAAGVSSGAVHGFMGATCGVPNSTGGPGGPGVSSAPLLVVPAASGAPGATGAGGPLPTSPVNAIPEGRVAPSGPGRPLHY